MKTQALDLANWLATQAEPVKLAMNWRSAQEPAPEQTQLAESLELLLQLKADQDTLSLACLRALPAISNTAATPPPCSDAVKALLAGFDEAGRIGPIYSSKPAKSGAEGIRRLLLVLIRDLRVVFVLLAQQLVALRHAMRDEQKRESLAHMAADIYAPLANRLGMWQIKWELEDLVFRALQPENYKRVAALLDERRSDRERYIALVIETLKSALEQAQIKANVVGRPKHMFSIWKKMSRKDLAFSELYDVRAVRILVDDVPACYAALAVVHALWPYIPKEFDDYIAQPKGNHYRSLHTAVVGPEGKAVEVQIRTVEMHEHAELGVAAHWRYKEGGPGDSGFERKIRELRDLIQSRDEYSDDDALLKGLSTDILEDRVYVLTPKGQVVDLRQGATVLDFAYAIHTSIGHRCRGAKVNGRIVPLTHAPISGDRIEILTAKEPKPARDWLIPSLGYLNTTRARGKVRQWFNENDFEQHVRDGKELLDREFKRTQVSEAELSLLLPKFEVKSLEEFYVGLALGDISPVSVLRMVTEQHKPAQETVLSKPKTESNRSRKDVIEIQGIGNLLWNLAQCCRPLPGDPILGYITKGRGVSVHRQNCASLKNLIAKDDKRVIEVQWGRPGTQRFPILVKLLAYDRTGLLRDITAVVAAEDLPIYALNTQLADGVAEIHLRSEVQDFGQLSTLLGKLRGVPNMLEAKRMG